MSNLSLKLYSFAMGFYPPRVLIYLREKGIPASEIEIVEVGFTGKGLDISAIHRDNPSDSLVKLRARTVPCLQIDNGSTKQYICTTIGVMEYLEVHFSEYKPMFGISAFERARVRDLISVLENVSHSFALYHHEACRMFGKTGYVQDAGAARVGRAKCKKDLDLLDKMIDTEGPFMTGGELTAADCVGYAVLQYGLNFYSIKDFLKGHENLKRWYAMFERRESVKAVQLASPEVAAAASEFSVPWIE